MYSIKQIPSKETFAVRLPVLRPGKPIESCIFEGDDLPSTVHFGIFEGEKIAGIVSVFEAATPLLPQQKQFQLRGMAVLDSYQKKGLGEKLVKAAEEYIKTAGGEAIWFNAREIAVGFYDKMGYKIIGNPFTLGDIGIHHVMYREA
ncbi:GNAT family N-acetyltransferase [Flavobacterium sp. DG1-102-2]|uniref:GNAT family N-acetyltransferase n=1 Tax=Flavobacterium sp. DG1-102-2 TaxID=3081663 RepID=UPI002948F387|nr:GNAT family N-acetyltransferase [Flavobacterium sp. DG1-102-2]MDV6169094.1 GNAT family N-acetyltransferase [Flavobacterium sp. DG1-102-2]